MNHKLANPMNMWKGNGYTTTLLFTLKGLEILHQERRGQVKTIVMENFNSFFFHKFGPANKQHTNQSINRAGLNSDVLIGILSLFHSANHIDTYFLKIYPNSHPVYKSYCMFPYHPFSNTLDDYEFFKFFFVLILI